MTAKRIRQGYILTAVSSAAQTGPDKVSLEEQERLAREYCGRNQIAVRKVFTIPGHSRYESDLPKLLEDYRSKGIPVYDDIADVWRKGLNGDVLVMYHDSRAARSKTVYTWITENWIRNGGEVYRIQGGLIDSQNEDFQIAMGAVSATGSIKYLVSARPAAMRRRTEAGFFPGSHVPFFHKYTYNDKGEQIQTEVDGKRFYLTVDRARWQPLIDDLYKLMVHDKTPYYLLPDALLRLGHTASDGKPYRSQTMKNILYAPPTHGILSIGYRRQKTEWADRFEMWKIDANDRAFVPEGVDMFYGACESVWKDTGNEAQFTRMIAEIRRRFEVVAGSAAPNKVHAFSGFIICAECGHTLCYTHSPVSGYTAYRCNYRYVKEPGASAYSCSQSKTLPFEKIRQYFDRALRAAIDDGGIPIFSKYDKSAHLKKDVKRLGDSLTRIEAQKERLAYRLADAPQNAVDSIYQLMTKLDNERLAVERQLSQAQAQIAVSTEYVEASRLAIETIREMKVENFWNRDEAYINQQLHAFLGNHRLVCENGEITDVIPNPGRVLSPAR